jgi:hypothetical protein
MTSPVRYFLLGLFVCFAPMMEIHSREFKSIDGKVINADIVTVRGADVVLKIAGKEYTVPINRLSAEDQEFIAEWKTKALEEHIPKLRIEVNSGKSDRSDKADFFDDRKGSVEFSVKILNEEIDFDLKGARASLVVIGEDAENRGRFGVMQKSSFEVAVEPGKTFEWKGDKLNYKFDDSPPAYWGTSYAGYVFQIRNAKGKVIFQNALPKGFEKHVDAILKMELKAAFDRDAKARGSIYIYDN